MYMSRQAHLKRHETIQRSSTSQSTALNSAKSPSPPAHFLLYFNLSFKVYPCLIRELILHMYR